MPSAIKKGAKGEEVRQLQQLLNKRLMPSANLIVDGGFGARTEAAVRLYQASVGLGIDGVVGPRTWMALETGHVNNPAKNAAIPNSFPEATWMDIAKQEIGQKEISGAQNNPRIISYHATTALQATNDETAWCSSFVNWCLKQVNITGTNSAVAASWTNWGQSAHALGGAVTVIHNSQAANSSLTTSGNHVGFLVQETETHYLLLGGNQSNQVKISSFPKSSWQLKGFRWPNSQESFKGKVYIY